MIIFFLQRLVGVGNLDVDLNTWTGFWIPQKYKSHRKCYASAWKGIWQNILVEIIRHYDNTNIFGNCNANTKIIFSFKWDTHALKLNRITSKLLWVVDELGLKIVYTRFRWVFHDLILWRTDYSNVNINSFFW